MFSIWLLPTIACQESRWKTFWPSYWSWSYCFVWYSVGFSPIPKFEVFFEAPEVASHLRFSAFALNRRLVTDERTPHYTTLYLFFICGHYFQVLLSRWRTDGTTGAGETCSSPPGEQSSSIFPYVFICIPCQETCVIAPICGLTRKIRWLDAADKKENLWLDTGMNGKFYCLEGSNHS